MPIARFHAYAHVASQLNITRSLCMVPMATTEHTQQAKRYTTMLLQPLDLCWVMRMLDDGTFLFLLFLAAASHSRPVSCSIDASEFLLSNETH